MSKIDWKSFKPGDQVAVTIVGGEVYRGVINSTSIRNMVVYCLDRNLRLKCEENMRAIGYENMVTIESLGETTKLGECQILIINKTGDAPAPQPDFGEGAIFNAKEKILFCLRQVGALHSSALPIILREYKALIRHSAIEILLKEKQVAEVTINHPYGFEATFFCLKGSTLKRGRKRELLEI